MIGYKQMAETFSYLDAQSEEGREFDVLVRERGIDPHDLVRVAEQRALRIALLQDGRDPTKFSRTAKTPVDLSVETREMMKWLMLAVIDGFIGGRCITDPDERVQRYPQRED